MVTVEEEKEGKRLAKKVNLLIDKIGEKNSQNQEKMKRIKELQRELKKLESQTNARPSSDEEELIQFLKDYCIIARRAYKEDAYIKYSYATKNSDFFYKIEKNVFDEYIENISSLDIKKFVSICVDLSLVKAEKNRRCVYPSGAIQVYYLSKPFIDKIVESVVLETQER